MANTVTGDNARDPAPAHRITADSPLLGRVIARVAELADELFDAGLSAVPGAAALPGEHFSEDVAQRIVAGSIVVLGAIDEGRDLEEHELAELVAPVIERRAEERIPLRMLTTAFFGGVERLWDETIALAGPGDFDDLIAISHVLLRVLRQVTIAIAETHADVEQSVYGNEREARRALCSALLRGVPIGDLDARADITVRDSYDVLALHVVPQDHAIPFADNVVARQRMRLAQQVLDELAATTALHTFDGISGIALLPVKQGVGIDELRYPEIALDLTRLFGLRVVAVEFEDVARADLPHAAAQIAEFVELAHRLGRPAGTYRLDDLMLEYQLTRPSAARDRLAARIEPLLEHPHLLEALEAHIRHGSDRKRAAAQVHVHPNSLSYRLRRVAELTGFDPADPYGSRLLAAALTVHRLYPPVGADTGSQP
ncbi:PucR family transcriptional regulator [Nocardia spumae]|uniref:PucR family transcriptional regulator n=1 Tax=Nocardia spumae TaxID=2887190 RepID=UPI001D156B4A|nr:helix-turn-helix domain-containing protein [Nocardia spumae]